MDLIAERSSPTLGSTATVRLFGGPTVEIDGTERAVPHGSCRLLAFAVLRPGRIERPYAAGVLWPDVEESRATSNLRSALWRMRRAGFDVLGSDKWSLWLDPGVQVDLRQTADWAGRLIHGVAGPDDLTLAGLAPDALHLLPGWYDDWVVIERERLRQRVLHALEALSRMLSERGDHADAIEVAFRAVGDERLRESAQRTLVQAYLAQGNQAEARQTYDEYARLIRAELGVDPSRRMVELFPGLPACPARAAVGVRRTS